MYLKHYLAEDKTYYINKRCSLNESVNSLVKYCKEQEKTLVVFSLGNLDRLKNIKSICKVEKVALEIIDDLSNVNINTQENGYVLDIDLDSIDKWYNWNVVIKNNLDNILIAADNIPLNEFKQDVESKAYECITQSEKEVYEHSNDKLDAFKLIKVAEKLLVLDREAKYLANIYTENIESNMPYISELTDILNLTTIKKYKDKCEYIYDSICEELESDIDRYNYCLFKGNKCIAQRENTPWPKNDTNGCCFDLNKKIPCEHLKCISCDITCISCRLFTCRYLKDRGINFDIKKNLMTSLYLNLLQKSNLVFSFFTPKERILKEIRFMSLKR